MAHHTHKLSHTTLEEDTCKLLCLDLLLLSDNTDCFYLEIEKIPFPLALHIVEAEQKMELKSESSTSIITNLNKENSDWKYNLVKDTNLFHYRDRIYSHKTLRKRVLKWYHCYLQHPGSDRLYQTLTTSCRWSGIVDQAQKLYRTCKDCHKFKKRNDKYGLLSAKDSGTLTPWHTVCVDLLGTYTILSKVRQHDNKILTK